MPDNQAILTDLVRQHWQNVWSFVYSIVKRRDVADDLTQDVFIRAYTHLDQFRGQSSAKTWLFAIAKHSCSDYLRSAFVRRVFPMSPTDRPESFSRGQETYPSAEAQVLRQTADNAVWRAVLQLKRLQREVVVLRIREDLSFREIADVIGITESNARVHYHRAILQLRVQLRQGVAADEL